jgi:zinc protease
MFTRILTSLVLGSGLLTAQTIPARPESLTFAPIVFKTPLAKDLKSKLKNGIPAFLAPNSQDGTPLVRVTVGWRGGGYLDPKGKEGLAQLFGAQLVQGGTTKLEPAKLEDRLESLAAQLTAVCGDTSGTLSLQVLEKDFDAGLELLIQTLESPAFSQDRLDLAKRQARQALSRRNDAVTSIATYQLNFLLFGEDHFASADPTAASLDSITREDLKGLHARLLHPSNLVVSMSGAFDRKVMLEKLNRTIGELKPGSEAKASPKVPAPTFLRKPGIYLTDKDAPQAMVNWAVPGLRRNDPDWHAAFVMNQLLGGSGFTSRLMKTIRSNEGLTYGVYTALGTGVHWQGDQVGRMQTKNRSVAYALRLAVTEMQKLKDTPVSLEELRVIQEGIVESFPSQWSGKQAIASRFAEEALQGWSEDWWVDFREKVQAVTPADVQRMARKYLDLDRLVILVVGKASEIEPGDADHPGALKDLVTLPLRALPLGDPQTMKPAQPMPTN